MQSRRSSPRAFVDNELLVVIAVVAVWIGLSLPLWARFAKELERRGARLGLLEHLGLAVAAFAAPVLFVALLLGLERLWEWLQERRRNRL